MKRIVVTGFDPFGGEYVNPAFAAVKQLPDVVRGVEIIKVELPTVFRKSGEILCETLRHTLPDAVLCVGQAGGRSAIAVEKVAINLEEARMADNAGNCPQEEAIVPDGPDAYFSTLPVKGMVSRLRAQGIPAFVSYSAGTYVCNDLMYHLMHWIATEFPAVQGGFVHVPYALEQAVDKPNGTPAWPVATIRDALVVALEAIIAGEEDSSVSAGELY